MHRLAANLASYGSVLGLSAVAVLACSEDDTSGGSQGSDDATTTPITSSADGGGASSTGTGGATTGASQTSMGGTEPSDGSAGGTTDGTMGGGGGSAGETSNDVSGSGGGDGSTSSGGGSAGTGGMPATVPPSCEAASWDPAEFVAVYEVGPDQDYETPSDVPWETLTPGSLVRIHWRDEPTPTNGWWRSPRPRTHPSSCWAYRARANCPASSERTP